MILILGKKCAIYCGLEVALMGTVPSENNDQRCVTHLVIVLCHEQHRV